MLFAFLDSEWHFRLDRAIEMASAYPHTPLLLHHYGCVDAPDFTPFNADPDWLAVHEGLAGRPCHMVETLIA